MSDTMVEQDFLKTGRRDSDSTTETACCALKEQREGGIESWFTALGPFLIYYASFGLINSFGFFSNYYKEEFLLETPSSTISFIGTLQILLMYVIGTVSGALCDSFGVKYLYIMSGLGVSSSLLVLSFVPLGGLWQTFFRDPRYAALCAGAWVAQIGIWVPNYYIESYADIIDSATPIKGYFLPLINGSSIFGMIVGGLVGDSIGRLNLLYPVTLNLGLLCIICALSSSIETLVIFCCLFGFFSGMFVGLIPPVVSQISPDEKLGARIGAFYCFIAISSLIGTPVGGALIKEETRGGYQTVIIYADGTLACGALVMLVSRLLHDRNLRAKW